MDDVSEILQIFKSKSTNQKEDNILLQPYIYITQIPSKQNRSKLVRAFNHWLDIPTEKLQLIDEILQILHDASILIDDIQDNGVLRRGKPVAHSIFGVPSTLNATTYVVFMALERVQMLNHPEAVKVFTEQMIESLRGQGMEIYWRDSFVIPTEAEYKLMAVRARAGFLIMAVKLMQLFSTNKKDFLKLTAIIGLYLQILDDYNNTSMKPGEKGFLADITEGKFSFPIIHAVRNPESNKEVLNILKQRTTDVELKTHCISLLEKLGSLKYTRDILESLDKKAREETDKLGSNQFMESLLNELLSWKKVIE